MKKKGWIGEICYYVSLLAQSLQYSTIIGEGGYVTLYSTIISEGGYVTFHIPTMRRDRVRRDIVTFHIPTMRRGRVRRDIVTFHILIMRRGRVRGICYLPYPHYEKRQGEG